MDSVERHLDFTFWKKRASVSIFHIFPESIILIVILTLSLLLLLIILILFLYCAFFELKSLPTLASGMLFDISTLPCYLAPRVIQDILEL